jgi:hypothetical protein
MLTYSVCVVDQYERYSEYSRCPYYIGYRPNQPMHVVILLMAWFIKGRLDNSPTGLFNHMFNHACDSQHFPSLQLIMTNGKQIKSTKVDCVLMMTRLHVYVTLLEATSDTLFAPSTRTTFLLACPYSLLTIENNN